MNKSIFRRNRRVLLSAVAAVAAVGLLAGCSGSGGGDSEGGTSAGGDCETTYTIGFSHPSGDVAAVKAVKAGAEAQAEANGCVELLLDNTVGNNLETQRAAVESWVNQKIDAIVVWPVDDAAMEGLREQAQANGTKWLTYAAPNPEEDGGVGFDNTTSGEEMTALLKSWVEENYPDGGITAAVTTATALPAVQPRVLPVIDYLNEAGIEIVSQQDCITPDCGLQIAEDMLRAHDDLKIFIGLNDDAGTGALRAYQNAGIDMSGVFIAGFDGTEEALVSLRDKTGYTASGAIPLMELGASIIDNSIAAITGEGDPTNLTPMVVVTADDTDQLDELLAAF